MKSRAFIPVKFPSLNQYIGAMNNNRFVANNMKQEFTGISKLHCRLLTPRDDRVLVHFTWYEKDKKRDPDNIVFAKKFILDGLVLAGVLPNDTQRWVKGFTDEIIVTKHQPPGVMVVIEKA